MRLAAALALVAGLLLAPAGAAASTPPAGQPGSAGAPYPCGPVEGANADAAAIGWLGNDHGALACLGGSFYVYNGINTTYGFGIYNDSPTTWVNADGYLPALVSTFQRGGADVSITNFGDRVVIDGHPFVAIYSRVRVHNATRRPVRLGAGPSPGLVPLNAASDTVPPGGAVDHDYVVAADRFGGSYPWPTDSQLEAAGSFSEHFAHMRAFWDAQLGKITQISLPDPQLVNAYKAGFAYVQIDRSGDKLDTGTNGYHAEFEHDVIGILASLLNEGYFTGAHALLGEVDTVVGTNGQYADGLWTYPWLWAVYLQKSGDLVFVKRRFAAPGPLGPSKQPSIEATAHQTAADRTGPGGIMEQTNDIDAHGYWTSDNFEALLGLASYGYLAKAVGNETQARWAASEYASLQRAVDATLTRTVGTYHLDYLPCSMLKPNTYNRCADPLDANWAAPGVYTNEAWHAYLRGATVSGFAGRSMAAWLDSTLRYGFSRTKGIVPPTTFGGYPGEGFYSTAYNAGYGAWGLASTRYRDQSILAYEFLIANDQAGPYAWWEGSTPPSGTTPWLGNHPASGGGSSPHSWGISLAAHGLLDSLASQMANGTLIVGRGIPNEWLARGKSIDLSNFPTTGGHRVGLRISSTGSVVSLRITATPSGPIVFDLPAFVHNIAWTSAGRVNESAGTVQIAPGTHYVAVGLRRLRLAPPVSSLRIDPAAAVHLGPGRSTMVTATFADSGPGAVRNLRLAIDAPRGWRVTPDGSSAVAGVSAGTTVTGRWRITAPRCRRACARAPQAIVTAVATYTDPATGRPERTTAAELGTPRIFRLSTAKAAAGQIVTVYGTAFGGYQGTSGALQFTDHGTTWSAPGTIPTLRVSRWTDRRIVFQVPAPSGPGGDTYRVTPGTTAALRVLTAGGRSNEAALRLIHR